MASNLDLGLDEIRSLAIGALRNFKEGRSGYGNNIQVTTLILEIAHESDKVGLKKLQSGQELAQLLSPKEHDRAREVITNLMSEGVLMWGIDRANPGPPFMGITEYGNKVLQAGEVIPHDIRGYLSKFKSEVSSTDPLIIKYLTESLETYRHNHLLSSSVMLGVASEAAFNILFEELRKSLTNRDKITKFEKLAKSISLKDRFDETMKEINRLKKLLPGKQQEEIESHINGIFELLRNQRNDSGHPTGKDVSRDDMLINLTLFITYCKDLYQLVKWIKDNPTWEGQV